MSGGGNSSPQMMFLPQQQNTTQEVKLPDWVNKASQGNYNEAASVAPQLSQYYQGQRVADMNGGQLNAINAINQNAGATSPYFQSALATTQGLQGYNPQQVQSGSLANTNYSQYMNPYTQNVIDSSMALLDQQRRNALNQNADNAFTSKAFGGSRQAIQDAATNTQYGLQGANMAAGLYNQAFSNAQNAAQQDISNNLQAQLANQSAGLQGANLGLNAANATGALAGAGQDAFLTGQNAALTGSGMLQQQRQNELAAQQQQFADMMASKVAPINLKMQALGMSPYGQTTTGSSSGFTSQMYQPTSSSPFMTGLGGALGGIGTIGKLFGLSDENEKTNIQKLGHDPSSGLPMYAYDYKEDVEEAEEHGKPMPPKRVGPMAQDIEKVAPKAVKKIGGKKVVNLGMGRRHG